MAMLSKAVLATAVISTGLLSSTGMAMADDAPGHGSRSADDHSSTSATEGGVTYQKGLVNLGDIKPNTSPDLCNNDLQSNLLGVQVPFQELAVGLGILGTSGDGATSPGSARGCSSPSAS